MSVIPGNTPTGTTLSAQDTSKQVDNFPFDIVPGSQGVEQMNFTPTAVVVSNPYNYYIYFPDCNQWVPPYAFNLSFNFTPSAPGTLRWNTTVDPSGNAQAVNSNYVATGLATTSPTNFSGGSLITPLSQPAAFVACGGADMEQGTSQQLIANPPNNTFIRLRYCVITAVSSGISATLSSGGVDVASFVVSSSANFEFDWGGFTVQDELTLNNISSVSGETLFRWTITYDVN